MPNHLDNWFALIDETPGVREFIQRIERSAGIDKYNFIGRLKPPPPGQQLPPAWSSSRLQWPTDREKRLGVQLHVFREIARRRLSVTDFAKAFIEDAGMESPKLLAVEYVFSPMARGLRRRLETELADREDSIPAADRIVTLDHNSATYAEAIEALEKLEEVLRGANDFVEPEEKEQRIAEVSAAHQVMQAVRVRVEPFVSLLKPIIVQFSTKLKDTIVGIAVSKVVTTLTALIGYVFKALLGG